MRSRESLRQLTRIESLKAVREKRAHAALRLALARHEELTRRLVEIADAIDATERERHALFEQHSGLMTRGGLYQLKRRESVLESRRIDLMLDHAEIESSLAQAQLAAQRARESLASARREKNKIECAADLFRQEINLQSRIYEEHEIEERRHEH